MYALVSGSHFSSILTRTAVERCSKESRFGKILTLDVHCLSSCGIGRSTLFEVRIRLWCAPGREKTARPSVILFSNQSAKSGLFVAIADHERAQLSLGGLE